MDPLWITLAFILGLGARRVGLPPLVGFLCAGFALQYMGVEGGRTLQELADLGVTLMLFSIGLKLKVKSLLRPEVWAATSIHMAAVTLAFGGLFYWLSLAGFSLFAGIGAGPALVLAFGLSFSSTVFAVKILEERGESSSLHGRTAVGILIMQDLIAVLFLTLAAGKIPSWWALVLLAALPLIRLVCLRIMDQCGHGELVVLFGLTLALVAGAGLFDLVGLKADLGALVIGVLVAGHKKADEISKALLSFKDLFLVGFFLNIGLSGAPTLESFGIALLLLPLVIFKGGLFFMLLARYSLRARTALLATLSLTNYSEFGLIVGAVAVKNGWLDATWLIAAALAMSLSFVAAAPLNAAAQAIYARLEGFLCRFETKSRHPEETLIDAGRAEIVVFGMGRVGQGAYDWMRQKYGDVVAGLDFNPEVVQKHIESGRKVVLGDASDPQFWERTRNGANAHVRLCLLTLRHPANLAVARLLRDKGYSGNLAAVARYEDELSELSAAGANAAFNLFAEAGAGFAEHVEQKLAFGSAGSASGE